VRELRGPSPAAAFQWTFGFTVPEYVTSLKSEYYSHLKGYGIYIGFIVPPDKQPEVIDVDSSRALYNETINYLELWRTESKFRELFLNGFPDLKTCRIIEKTIDGESREIVYNPTTGHVFCWYVSDSDISP
jgi:hypothetical protein